MPATTLEFANLCLTNASILLPTEIVLEENMTKFLQNEKPIPGDEDKEWVRIKSSNLYCRGISMLFGFVSPGNVIVFAHNIVRIVKVSCLLTFELLLFLVLWKEVSLVVFLLMLLLVIQYKRKKSIIWSKLWLVRKCSYSASVTMQWQPYGFWIF